MELTRVKESLKTESPTRLSAFPYSGGSLARRGQAQSMAAPPCVVRLGPATLVGCVRRSPRHIPLASGTPLRRSEHWPRRPAKCTWEAAGAPGPASNAVGSARRAPSWLPGAAPSPPRRAVAARVSADPPRPPPSRSPEDAEPDTPTTSSSGGIKGTRSGVKASSWSLSSDPNWSAAAASPSTVNRFGPFRLPDDEVIDHVKEEYRLENSVYYDLERWKFHRSSLRYLTSLTSSPRSKLLQGLALPLGMTTLISCLVGAAHTAAHALLDSTPLEHIPPFMLGDDGRFLHVPVWPYTLASSALALVLVFRTQASYSRWVSWPPFRVSSSLVHAALTRWPQQDTWVRVRLHAHLIFCAWILIADFVRPPLFATFAASDAPQWQGRGAWRVVIQESRDIGRRAHAWIEDPRLRAQIVRHAAAFPRAMHAHLFGGGGEARLEGLQSRSGLPGSSLMPDELAAVLEAGHAPQYCLQARPRPDTLA